MIYILLILSFIFESIITNIVHINSFLIPLFLLTSLVILYPYFRGNKLNFIITCIICGLIYDISFSDSAFINMICFGLSGLFIILCYSYFKYSIYSISLINISNIILYRIITYLLLVVIDYIRFNINILFAGIYKSLIINIVYGIIIYLLADVLAKLFNIKRV